MVAQQLGKAFIEVRADLSKFPAELRAQLQKAFREGVAGVEFTGLNEKAEKAGEEAATHAGSGFKRKARVELKKAGEEAGKVAGEGLFAAIRKIFSRDRGEFAAGVRGLFDLASDAVKSGVDRVQGVAQGVSGFLGSAISGGGDIIGAIKIAGILALIPAVFALAGALVHLSGILLTLPSIFGVVVSAIAPLIIAFQGFGGAISAGFSGDLGKFNEALKKLAPSARSVVKEIVALKKPFEALKQSVQQAFFAPLVGTFKQLGQTVLPLFGSGFTKIASSLGFLFRDVLGTLKTPAGLAAIKATLDATLAIIQRFEPALTNLFAGFGEAARVAAPFVVRLFQGIADGLTRLGTFLSKAAASGDLAKFLENSFTIGKDLLGVLGALGRLIKTLFGGQDVFEGSSNFLNDIETAINKLSDFFASPDGQQAIEGMLKTIKALGVTLIALAIFLGKAIHWAERFGHAIDVALDATVRFFHAVGKGAVDAVQAVGGFFAKIGGAIADFFTKTIPAAFDAVVDFFQGLPDRAVEAGSSLKDRLVEWVTDALRSLRDRAAEEIGHIIGIFLSLPFLAANAAANLGPFLLEKFLQAFDAVRGFVAARLDELVGFLFSLPGRAQAALISFRDLLVATFREGLDRAVEFVRSGLDRISAFIGSLPDRVRAIGPALLNAARSLGQKIGDGLSQIGNFASDIGQRIVRTIKGGINSIIDGINRGIADIDDKIPIGLPRLPHFERGGIVDSPTVALLGERGKREVVLPLTDPARANQLAQESGLTKILAAGAKSPTVNLTAILDGFGLIRVIKMVVDGALSEQGQELAFGART